MFHTKEIERKFLIKSLPINTEVYPGLSIEQFYISDKPEIRARKTDNMYQIDIKTDVASLVRNEYSITITEEEYYSLKKQCISYIITKQRHQVPLDASVSCFADVDIYTSSNLLGLEIVEVEFHDEEVAKSFVPPDWFGREVTNELEYRNRNLAKLPFYVIN